MRLKALTGFNKVFFEVLQDYPHWEVSGEWEFPFFMLRMHHKPDNKVMSLKIEFGNLQVLFRHFGLDSVRVEKAVFEVASAEHFHQIANKVRQMLQISEFKQMVIHSEVKGLNDWRIYKPERTDKV